MPGHRTPWERRNAAKESLERRRWRRFKTRYIPAYLIIAALTFGHEHNTAVAITCGETQHHCKSQRDIRMTIGATAFGVLWPAYWAMRAGIYITNPERWP